MTVENIITENRDYFYAYYSAHDLLEFIRFTKEDYEIKWYHKLLCKKLEMLYSGEIRRLMVFMPPQHGKSECVSRRFPAWILGKNPKLQIAGCSYSADLACKFNREVQRIMTSEEYKMVFPETRLNDSNVVSNSKGSWLRNSDIFEVVDHGGSYRGVGVGGPLTGNRVDMGIIDDPIKDRAEANSETYRNRLWEWYTDVFMTRLNNDSKLLLTVTRWHEDDLAGRILQKEKDWYVLSLPAIRENYDNDDDPRKIGEALWPERHNIDELNKIMSLSKESFAAMYQQRPAPAEGGIFKRHWWKEYTQLPQRINRLIQVWDCSFKDLKTSDYCVGGVFALSGSDCYMVDLVRAKYDFPETIKAIRALKAKYPHTQEIYIEDKANGTAVIQTLKSEIVGIVPISPTEGKESRAYAVSNIIESGHVYLLKSAEWLAAALYELSVFPNGANDDIVDVIVYALRKLYTHNTSTVVSLKI